MRIKIKILKKIIFDWRVKSKRTINLAKGSKKNKRTRIKIDIKNKKIYWMKSEIEKNNNFYKTAKKKIKNKKNKGQIEKHNTINLNWIMKLKTNKTFIKGLKKKNQNQNNKDQVEKYNIW
jgi:hypothetical protein